VLGYGYAPPEEYKKSYRGMVTMWKFDRAKGRIDESQLVRARAAALLAGPVPTRASCQRRLLLHQLVQHRDGDGRHREGQPAVRGRRASKRDMDYLHIIDWKKAEAAFKAGKAKKINGFPVIIRSRRAWRRASCTSRPSPRARTAWT
jgi:nitrous-oxide reductase